MYVFVDGNGRIKDRRGFERVEFVTKASIRILIFQILTSFGGGGGGGDGDDGDGDDYYESDNEGSFNAAEFTDDIRQSSYHDMNI